MNPERIELQHQKSSKARTLLGNLKILRSQRTKLQHAVERLIDSFTEGLIEKGQFTPRMDRTKHRIADLDARIRDNAGDIDQLERLQLATSRFRELAAAIGPELPGADWQRRREIIRTLVQRIDIDTEVIKIIFRVTQNARDSRSLECYLKQESRWHCSNSPGWIGLRACGTCESRATEEAICSYTYWYRFDNPADIGMRIRSEDQRMLSNLLARP